MKWLRDERRGTQWGNLPLNEIIRRDRVKYDTMREQLVIVLAERENLGSEKSRRDAIKYSCRLAARRREEEAHEQAVGQFT